MIAAAISFLIEKNVQLTLRSKNKLRLRAWNQLSCVILPITRLCGLELPQL